MMEAAPIANEGVKSDSASFTGNDRESYETN
jgi:hypothetical protein